MAINIRAASYAAGIAGGILSLVCAFFVAIAPQATLNVANSIFHGIDVTMIAKQNMTITSIILGVIVVAVISGATVALFGWFYNKFMGR